MKWLCSHGDGVTNVGYLSRYLLGPDCTVAFLLFLGSSDGIYKSKFDGDNRYRGFPLDEAAVNFFPAKQQVTWGSGIRTGSTYLNSYDIVRRRTGRPEIGFLAAACPNLSPLTDHLFTTQAR